MITLPEPPRLVPPTTAVRLSYLTGEQADKLQRGESTDWLAAASEDFDSFVADRVGVPSAGACRRLSSGASPARTTWARS